MGKVRSFASKVAHATSHEGKDFCPKCNTEIRIARLIRNRKKKSSKWAPKYEFVKICKCNEKDVMAGNI